MKFNGDTMPLNKAIGISDLTSSESSLKRFTFLCNIVKLERGLNKQKLFKIAKETSPSPFKNPNVTGRHLAIMQKIGLIEDLGGAYILTSDGKVLCELSQEPILSSKLTFVEQAIFMKNLFSSLVRRQLVELLQVIMNNRNEINKKIVYDFFSTQLAISLWNKITVERNLTRLRDSGKIPTFFVNKFTCMERWLEDLGLIRRINGRIDITNNGIIILSEIKKLDSPRDEICQILGKILVDKAIFFDLTEHKDLLTKKFREAFSLFKIDSNVGDIKAIQLFLCLEFLKQGIIMEDKAFPSIIDKLSSDGLIRSVMLGRDGKLGYVALS